MHTHSLALFSQRALQAASLLRHSEFSEVRLCARGGLSTAGPMDAPLPVDSDILC